MKSRLAASIPFLPGARSNNICRTWKAFSVGLTSVQHGSSNRWVHSSSMEDDSFAELGSPVTERAVSQLKLATERLGPNRWVHSSSMEDDSYAELGPPVTERAVSQLKLATEKRECFIWKNDSARKTSPNKFLPVDKNHKKGTVSKIVPVDKNHKKGPVSTHDEPCQSIAEPMDASNASSLTDTIRIQGIGEDASIHKIHSLCKTLGNLEGLAWVGKDAIDVFFTVASQSDSKKILKKLNDTVIGNSHLSASLLSSNSTASMSIKEIASHERGLQFSTSIDELKRQLKLKRVYLEDLELLRDGIMHLQCSPTTSD